MDLGYKPTTERIERMKKAGAEKALSEMEMRDILDDKDIAPKKVTPPPAPVPAPQPAPVSQPAQAPAVQTGTNSAPVQPEQAATPPQPIPAAQAGQNAPDPQTIPASPDNVPQAPTANQTASEQPPVQVPSPAPAENGNVIQFPTQQASGQAPEAAKEDDVFKGPQERPEITKVILTGDRLRKYFPDVSLTPREIEESVYEALEERRQRQERQKQKEAIFKRSAPAR